MDGQTMLRSLLIVLGATLIAFGIATGWYAHENREISLSFEDDVEVQGDSSSVQGSGNGTATESHEIDETIGLLAVAAFTVGVWALMAGLLIPAKNPTEPRKTYASPVKPVSPDLSKD